MGYAMWNARYYDPLRPDKKQLPPALSIRYGATRKGVHLITEDDERAMEAKTSFNYIARRKGVAYVDGEMDGLFNAFGKADLSYETERVSKLQSVMWKGVLSLKKEDAERLGYTNVDAFRQLLNRHMAEVAKAYDITPQNLIWNAAYHPVDKNGNDHHPHIHLYFQSKDPAEGRMDRERTLKAFEKCRSIFTNDIFREDLSPIKEQYTKTRDELKHAFATFRFDGDAAINSGLYDEFQKLAKELPTTGRRVSYQYLPEDCKKRVDAVCRLMVQQPGIDRAYAAYKEAFLQQIKVYNLKDSAIEARVKKWENAFFHPAGKHDRRDFHNAVIRTARDLAAVDKKSARRETNIREIRSFVGLSAISALELAQTDAGYRHWLTQLAEQYGTEDLPLLMRSAQTDNWREIYRSVHKTLRQDPVFREALVNEVRLYLDATKQEAGAFSSKYNRRYPSALGENTVDGVKTETQRILYGVRVMPTSASSNVTRVFYEAALDQRVRQWLRSQPDICKELRALTGAVRYWVHDEEHPCPPDVYNLTYATTSELLVKVSAENPDIKKERDLLLIRSLTEHKTFKGLDRVLNGVLDEAYRQEINEVFIAVLQTRSDQTDVFEKVKTVATVDGRLTKEVYGDLEALVLKTCNRPIDERGVGIVSRRLACLLFDERTAQDLAERNPKEWLCLREIVALRSDAQKLQSELKVTKILRALVKSIDEEIPQDRIECALLWQAYSQNLSEQMQELYIRLPSFRDDIDRLAQEIRCGMDISNLTDEQRECIQQMCPDIPMDDKAKILFQEKVLQYIEVQRLRTIVHIPKEGYEDLQKVIGLRRDVATLIRDPEVLQILQMERAHVCCDPEIAQANQRSIDRVLVEKAIQFTREDYVEYLYTPESRVVFSEQAKDIVIGQAFSEMPANVKKQLRVFLTPDCDEKGRDMMICELEKRIYNERFFILSRRPEVKSALAVYLNDPHRQSLINRGVTFDELSPCDRAELTQFRLKVQQPEVASQDASHQDQLDRAFYRAAQNEYHWMRTMEHGARDFLGYLITATIAARQIAACQAQTRNVSKNPAEKKNFKKKVYQKRQNRHEQEPYMS